MSINYKYVKGIVCKNVVLNENLVSPVQNSLRSTRTILLTCTKTNDVAPLDDIFSTNYHNVFIHRHDICHDYSAIYFLKEAI